MALSVTTHQNCPALIACNNGNLFSGAVVDVLSGALAGVANTVVGHPLDTLKVWAQTRPRCASIAPTGSLLTPAGLYRGIGPPLLSTPMLSSLNFAIYERARLILWHKDLQMHPVKCAFFAGVIAGYAVCHITNPLHVVKVQQQTEQIQKSSSIISVCQKLWKQHGVRSLFRGYMPHAVMESLGRGVYMATFEGSKQIWDSDFLHSIGLNDDGDCHRNNQLSLGRRLICGSLAGVAAWVAAYPFDVVRNNMMRAARNGKRPTTRTFQCARNILQTEGVMGFYRGLTFTVLRAGPVAAVTLATYDICRVRFSAALA